MPAHTNRPYRDHSDIARMKHVAGAMFVRVPSHPLGGIEWIVFGPHGFPPSEIVRLWERADGSVVGWAVLASDDGFDYRVLPELCGTDLEKEIFDWAASGINTWRSAHNLAPRLVVECWGGDQSRIDLLAARGFRARGIEGVVFTRSLESELPPPSIPAGWRIEGFAEQHIDSRARTQYEAFAPGSRTTPATWRALMRNAPGYDPDLDNVAISPDGEVASAALVWLDERTKIGEFEPVGTRPQFQQQGLGKAVLLRGLAKMRERGVTTAIVGTNATNAPAIALYQSVGFDIVNRMTAYER